MEIKTNDKEARMLLDEKIDLSNSHLMKEKFFELLGQEYSNIVLDFTQVKQIDSSGLGKILLFQKELREKNGSLKIVNITSEYVEKMFRMVHLDKVVDIE